jgi:hypothetical protein
MKRTTTITGVADVPQSFKWYQSFWAYRNRLLHFAKPGNGILLFLRVDDFDVALAKGRTLVVSRLEEEPHLNPTTGTRRENSVVPAIPSPSARSIRLNGIANVCFWPITTNSL